MSDRSPAAGTTRGAWLARLADFEQGHVTPLLLVDEIMASIRSAEAALATTQADLRFERRERQIEYEGLNAALWKLEAKLTAITNLAQAERAKYGVGIGAEYAFIRADDVLVLLGTEPAGHVGVLPAEPEQQ